MPVKAIRFEDVKRGDVVSKNLDLPTEVERVGVDFECGPRRIVLICKDGILYRGRPSDLIALVGQAQSKGKSKAQMQEDVLILARRLLDCPESEKDEVARKLRETIEVYELGKLSAARGGDDYDPRVDESSGFLGGGPV